MPSSHHGDFRANSSILPLPLTMPTPPPPRSPRSPPANVSDNVASSSKPRRSVRLPPRMPDESSSDEEDALVASVDNLLLDTDGEYTADPSDRSAPPILCRYLTTDAHSLATQDSSRPNNGSGATPFFCSHLVYQRPPFAYIHGCQLARLAEQIWTYHELNVGRSGKARSRSQPPLLGVTVTRA